MEPNILKKLIKYDFVINIISSFQDHDNFYLITNYFDGDILFNYKDEYMTETQLKFISACIIQSLVYLRKEKIINRDVRMKNIIMDKQKYLNLIDFSFAIKYSDKDDDKNDITASKLESAPEILNRSIYDYNSDYYRIGTILYYLIFKQYANNIKNNNKREIIIDYKSINNYSSSCIDFLNKLLTKNYKKRIGFKSIDELKRHPWYKRFDWKKFEQKRIRSPLKFMKKKFKLGYCKKFNITKKPLFFNNYKNKKLYLKLINKFDYVNTKIVMKIFNLKNKQTLSFHHKIKNIKKYID